MFRARTFVAVSLGVAALAVPGGFAGPGTSSPLTTGAASPPQLSQLLGFANGSLVRIDPQSLQPLPGNGIRVGSGGCAPRSGGTACWSIPPWTVSPNGHGLAVVRNDAASLQLVDVDRMRVTANIRIAGGAIGALAWLTPRRLLALQEIPGERQQLLVVDLATRRVVARQALGSSVRQLVSTARELVMLLAPAQSIGPARIAVADRQGRVRFVRLPRILAGSKLLGRGSSHRVDARGPGLAVDPQGRRAFVVDKGLAAEIDLESLAVSYKTLERKASLLSRLWNWLEPAAAAKQVSGHAREVRWLGGGLLALSGTDTEAGRTQPAGLLLVDTGDWKVRTLDRNAMTFQVGDDALLAMGSSWDAAAGRPTGMGLAAYGFDGGKRFQLFDGQQAWVARVYGGKAYVGVSGQDELHIVDLTSGSVVATRPQQLPWLLLGGGAGWWGG